MSLVSEETICSELGIQTSLLREWVNLGLVRSASSEGTMTFESAQVRRIWSIHSLHYDLGVNLEGVQMVLKLSEQLGEARAILSEVRKLLDENDPLLPERRSSLKRLIESMAADVE